MLLRSGFTDNITLKCYCIHCIICLQSLSLSLSLAFFQPFSRLLITCGDECFDAAARPTHTSLSVSLPSFSLPSTHSFTSDSDISTRQSPEFKALKWQTQTRTALPLLFPGKLLLEGNYEVQTLLSSFHHSILSLSLSFFPSLPSFSFLLFHLFLSLSLPSSLH